MTKVMAVILNYNSLGDTKKCIKYLKEQKDVDLQICVVDNCSSDEENEQLKKLSEGNNITVIFNKENQGYSAGNNIGLKKAAEQDCDYAMIINPDVEIRDELYVKKAVEQMEGDDQIAVLGTNVINIHNQHQNPIKEMNLFKETCFPILLLARNFHNGLPNVQKNTKSRYCDKVSGCVFFISIPFIKEVGYLDENVFLYCEESILGKVVKMNNKKTYYYADITAYHMHHSNDNEESLRKWGIYLESRIYYLKKYSGYKGIKLKLAIKSRNLQYKMYQRKFEGK